MTRQELASQIENLEWLQEQQREENQVLKKDLVFLKNQLENSKTLQEELRKKLNTVSLREKTVQKDFQVLQQQVELERGKVKKLANQQEKIKKVLESQNRENYSGLKQIKSLYANDPIVTQVVTENIQK